MVYLNLWLVKFVLLLWFFHISQYSCVLFILLCNILVDCIKVLAYFDVSEIKDT